MYAVGHKSSNQCLGNNQKFILQRICKKKIILCKTSVSLLSAIVVSAKDLFPNNQALGGQD